MKLTFKREEKAAYRQELPWLQGGFKGRPRESKYCGKVGGASKSIYIVLMIGQNVRDIGIF